MSNAKPAGRESNPTIRDEIVPTFTFLASILQQLPEETNKIQYHL